MYGTLADFKQCYDKEMECANRSDSELQMLLDEACAEVNICIKCCGQSLSDALANIQACNAMPLLRQAERKIARYNVYKKVDKLGSKMRMDYEDALAMLSKFCKCSDPEETGGIIGDLFCCFEEECIPKTPCIQCGCCGCGCDAVNASPGDIQAAATGMY